MAEEPPRHLLPNRLLPESVLFLLLLPPTPVQQGEDGSHLRACPARSPPGGRSGHSSPLGSSFPSRYGLHGLTGVTASDTDSQTLPPSGLPCCCQRTTLSLSCSHPAGAPARRRPDAVRARSSGLEALGCGLGLPRSRSLWPPTGSHVPLRGRPRATPPGHRVHTRQTPLHARHCPGPGTHRQNRRPRPLPLRPHPSLMPSLQSSRFRPSLKRSRNRPLCQAWGEPRAPEWPASLSPLSSLLSHLVTLCFLFWGWHCSQSALGFQHFSFFLICFPYFLTLLRKPDRQSRPQSCPLDAGQWGGQGVVRPCRQTWLGRGLTHTGMKAEHRVRPGTGSLSLPVTARRACRVWPHRLLHARSGTPACLQCTSCVHAAFARLQWGGLQNEKVKVPSGDTHVAGRPVKRRSASPTLRKMHPQRLLGSSRAQSVGGFVCPSFILSIMLSAVYSY